MKNLLWLLFLFISVAIKAQTRTISDLPGSFSSQLYRGNPITFRIKYPNTVSSARAIYYKGKGLSRYDVQATVTDSTAEGITLNWPESTNYPDAGWLEIILNGKVAAAGTLNISYQTANAPKMDVLTFNGTDSAPFLNITNSGSIVTKFFPVSGAVNGHVLTHNANSQLVTGYFIRSDNRLVDPLWYPVFTSDNAAKLMGPPGETATGTVVVNVYLN